MELPLLKVLILCGGHSSRMGTAKHLLPFLDGRPIYQHLIERANSLSADFTGVYLSLRDAEQGIELSRLGHHGPEFQTVYDNGLESSAAEIGPAAGLLAAAHEDATANWLVIACDYPLLSCADMQLLLDNKDDSLVCFRNSAGWAEPLLGIWSTLALQRLQQNVERGITGPRAVVRDLNARTLTATKPNALFNSNTTEEWHHAMEIAADMDFYT